MSYPHGQFPEDFSNPTTPLFPTWETMENEEQQQPQQSQQPQQLQHRSQQPQQQQSDTHSPTGLPPHTPQQHPTIQLEESTHVVPSQQRSAYDDAPVRLYQVHQGSERPRQSMREVDSHLHVDTLRSSSASTSAGPVRQTRSSQHQQQVHPYRRPPSATTAVPPTRQQPLVRFTSIQPPSSSVHSPAIPSPASVTSRLASYGSGIGSPVDTLLAPTIRHERRRLYLLRTDSHYDPESKKLIAMLEVPGVRKADVRVTLSTCTWNGVRQITVSGITRPVFPSASTLESTDGVPELTIRERKYGEFARTFAVPTDVNREDIEASMEDGVLTIKVPCGIPVHPNPEDIPVR